MLFNALISNHSIPLSHNVWQTHSICQMRKPRERELRGLPRLVEKSEKQDSNIGELPPVLTCLLPMFSYAQMCSFNNYFNVPTMIGPSGDG